MRQTSSRAARLGRVVAAAAAVAALSAGVVACGGSVAPDPEAEEGGVDAATDGRVDAKTDSAVDSRRDTAVDSAFDTALDTWIEPECPDAGPPIKDYKCDPLAPPPGGCKATEACYPYVEYPTERCMPETYHTRCFPAGKGKQGEPCSGGECAAGHVCVATGAGNMCSKMCKPGAIGACPDGYVCSPTDVPDIGACL